MTIFEQYNTPSLQFKEALEKGILSREPLFSINGVDFYVFAKGLTMISAERYIQYQEHLRFYNQIGLSKEISSDYINDAIEELEDLRRNADDMREVISKTDSVITMLRVYEEHKSNTSIVGLMLELCSIALINPCENPYRVDYVHNAEKIKMMNLAMEQPNGDEFTLFFWKLSSLDSMDWIGRLMEFTPYWAKEESKMTKEEKEKYQTSQNLLILDILKTKKKLDDTRLGKGSSSRVKELRTTLNLAKQRLNSRVLNLISNTKNLQTEK